MGGGRAFGMKKECQRGGGGGGEEEESTEWESRNGMESQEEEVMHTQGIRE